MVQGADFGNGRAGNLAEVWLAPRPLQLHGWGCVMRLPFLAGFVIPCETGQGNHLVAAEAMFCLEACQPEQTRRKIHDSANARAAKNNLRGHTEPEYGFTERQGIRRGVACR